MRLESVDAAMAKLYAYLPHANLPRSGAERGEQRLDRMREFLQRIGNPQDAYRVVHIAGTSGKTSTAYFIRALLQEAGVRTGLTVSPHISSLAERVQVDGHPISERELLDYLGRFLDLVERSRLPLTYFEVLIAFAYWVFADRAVGYAVVETGRGGLLDATNTVGRADKLCVIADLGLDHTEVLGGTIEEIARHKSGIVQPGNHVVVIDQAAGALVAELATGRGGFVHIACSGSAGPVAGFPPGLPGFQQRNWCLASTAYDHLARRDGLPARSAATDAQAAAALPPGRLERRQVQGRSVILDGAHNPQKLAALRTALAASGVSGAAVLASFLAAPDQRLDAALTELLPITAHLIATSFTVVPELGKQSPPAVEVAAHARAMGYPSVQAEPELATAVAALLRRPEPVLLVTGSLYLVGQVRSLLAG